MKPLKYIPALLTACLLFSSTACKKDKEDPTPGNPNSNNTGAYTCTSCVKTPEAKPEYNESSRGIYKGILVASTGTVRFNIGNDGSTINAVMVIDGTTVNLTSSIAWEDGEPYVAPFTGVMNNQPVSITFSVRPDGTDPEILSSDIPGHPNANFTLVKETSNALIEAFEGNYKRSDGKKGTLNILLSRTLKKWGAIAREEGTNEADDASGTITEDNKIVEKDGTVMGTLSSDEIKGNFKDGKNRNIEISAKRTL